MYWVQDFSTVTERMNINYSAVILSLISHIRTKWLNNFAYHLNFKQLSSAKVTFSFFPIIDIIRIIDRSIKLDILMFMALTPRLNIARIHELKINLILFVRTNFLDFHFYVFVWFIVPSWFIGISVHFCLRWFVCYTPHNIAIIASNIIY